MASATPNQAVKIVKWACILVAFVAASGAFLGARGCERSRELRELKEGERIDATIKGKTFRLEPVLDDRTRVRGLGGRTDIAEDGGMVFVFPEYVRQNLHFVMRDCLVPIDIAFCDDTGHVLTIYEMPIEPPKADNEDARTYENRLKKYPSRFPCRIAVEVKGGTFAKLGLKPGDLIESDWDTLKARAQ